MSDRKLLELAAKAAGISNYYVSEWVGGVSLMLSPNPKVGPIAWDPLTDDGDAFRLAVKLNIELRFHLAGDVPGVTATCAADSRLPIPREPWTPKQGDKPAATRRAIVRAAAEIGKTMP